ncbi:AAA family ATPase [Epibacterium ulvae]|uniref:AAA family ATPase n=1 Tax=Epibacterium ulvae TaxID=1156985 RepID=UPI001BFC45F9|nr:AAA family ATPase [Epibacterium ulvae]MBT8152557.1 AAA family ATPase [Epibacterium ulvae]
MTQDEHRPKRIMIIGGPGSGKSTLARQLGQALHLPVKHMDREVHWLPGWQERNRAEKAPIVARIIAEPEWVFEGGHSTSYADRLARADLLIWVDAPLRVRLVRVIRRTLRDHGKIRPDMQDGCPEQLANLPGFLWFILRIHRASQRKKRALYERAQIPKYHLTSFKQINRFVAERSA